MRRMRLLGIAVAVLVMLFALAAPAAASFFLDGEEMYVLRDPISRREGLLLPTDVFERLQIKVESRGPIISLTRGETTISGILGLRVALKGQTPILVQPAPLRIGGHLYLPQGLLEHFGVEMLVDGSTYELRDLVGRAPAPAELTDAAYAALFKQRTITPSLRVDSSNWVESEITYLTPELVNTRQWSANPVLRAQVLDLLPYYTVLQVRINNNVSQRLLTFSTQNFLLVDNLGQQYELQRTIAVRGSLDGKIAPDVQKTGLLVFPKVAPPATNFMLYYELGNHRVHTFLMN